MPLLSADKEMKKQSALEPLVQEAALNENVKFRRVFPMGNMVSVDSAQQPLSVLHGPESTDAFGLAKTRLAWGCWKLPDRNVGA